MSVVETNTRYKSDPAHNPTKLELVPLNNNLEQYVKSEQVLLRAKVEPVFHQANFYVFFYMFYLMLASN